MAILDAEYQFDRHKLTFFFEADKRIDFRDLVSELFSQFKTRIWMQQVDTSSLPLQDPGLELAKATGFLPDRESDYISCEQAVLEPLKSLGRNSLDFDQSVRLPLDLYEKRPLAFAADPWTPNRF